MGNKNAGNEIGFDTRFSGKRAAEMGRKGHAAMMANKPIRLCLKGIATEGLYGHPNMPSEQLKPIAKFFNIKIHEVTYAHVAIFEQLKAMSKGDQSALNTVAAYAGEKPTENVNITHADFSALDEAFDGLRDDDE